MTRVTTICGSLGEASANRAALRVVQHTLTQSGVEVVEDDSLAEIPPLRPEQVDDPVDAVVRFRRSIADADAVVIAAPEYAGSLAGTLKNALDWVVGSGELYQKPVGILSAGTTGGPFARQVLAQTLLWQGAHLVAQLGVAAPRTKSDAQGNITDAETVALLQRLARTVASSPEMSPETREHVSVEVAASVGAARDAEPPAAIRREAAPGQAPECYACGGPMEVGKVYGPRGLSWVPDRAGRKWVRPWSRERITFGFLMNQNTVDAVRCRSCSRIVILGH